MTDVRQPTYKELVLMGQIKASGGKPVVTVLSDILGRPPYRSEMSLFSQLASQKRKRIDAAINGLRSSWRREPTPEELLKILN